MHIDHAGGIADFPWATVHVYEKEYQAAVKNRTSGDWLQSSPMDASRELAKILGNRFNLVWIPRHKIAWIFAGSLFDPMPGHTPGHCMVAFSNGEKWILQTGSAAYPFTYPRSRSPCPGWFQRWLMGENLPQLKQLWQDHGNEIQFLAAMNFAGNKKVETSGSR